MTLAVCRVASYWMRVGPGMAAEHGMRTKHAAESMGARQCLLFCYEDGALWMIICVMVVVESIASHMDGAGWLCMD